MLVRLPANDGCASDERIEAAELYIFGLPSSRVLRAGPQSTGSGSGSVGHISYAQASES